MLKRPSSRRKSSHDQIALNLVPILDTMVTLIGFLLFTMSFLALVHIETPVPQASAPETEKKLKEKPLQLTVTLRDTELEVWSPFDRIPSKKLPNLADGKLDIPGLHATLIDVKKKFPTDNRTIVVPYGKASYEKLIAVMDATRLLEPTDPPFYQKNEKTGVNEAVKTLFPEVIFGNLLGDN